MGCDALQFIDTDLYKLDNEGKAWEFRRRLGDKIHEICFTSWPEIGKQITVSGFYMDAKNEAPPFFIYADVEKKWIYHFDLDMSVIGFDVYDYERNIPIAPLYTDRWYCILENYLGKKHECFVNCINDMKNICKNIFAPLFHSKYLLIIGDQVYIHERVFDLFYEEKEVLSLEEILKKFDTLKYFSNENEIIYDEKDDDVLTFLYNLN